MNNSDPNTNISSDVSLTANSSQKTIELTPFVVKYFKELTVSPAMRQLIEDHLFDYYISLANEDTFQKYDLANLLLRKPCKIISWNHDSIVMEPLSFTDMLSGAGEDLTSADRLLSPFYFLDPITLKVLASKLESKLMEGFFA